MKKLTGTLLTSLALLITLAGCFQPAPGSRPWLIQNATEIPQEVLTEAATDPILPTPLNLPTQRPANSPYYTPTPDQPRTLPTLRTDVEIYIVQPGDYLAAIALKFNMDVEYLLAANELNNPDVLEVGQEIIIPALIPSVPSSNFKVIPDSELVYGPMSSTLNISEFIKLKGGYLATYTNEVDDVTLSGAQVVERVCAEFSVNPRLVLAILEYRSGWVTSKKVDSETVDYPLLHFNVNYKGLYLQLAWMANQLNRGYYLWKINALSDVNLGGGKIVRLDPTLNAGTAGVQYALGQESTPEAWQQAVSAAGVYQTYKDFFGIPFDLAFSPLLPADLEQPEMRLPFEKYVAWSFTGGPHAGWGSGSAWAALDFAPPGKESGCFKSDAWVTAVADGVILRTAYGEVVQDLDEDGLEQTGWTVLYMHIGTQDRVAAGSIVKAGDRIGHASCEGGITDGTHVHLARRYNGEWISADTGLPFILSGWVSAGVGEEYCGTLIKDGQTVYSWNGRVYDNQIEY